VREQLRHLEVVLPEMTERLADLRRECLALQARVVLLETQGVVLAERLRVLDQHHQEGWRPREDGP
jgi:hypothetical protein